MKNLFVETELQSITERLNSLNGAEQRLWGTMTLGQMLRHCRLQLDMALKHVQPRIFSQAQCSGLRSTHLVSLFRGQRI